MDVARILDWRPGRLGLYLQKTFTALQVTTMGKISCTLFSIMHWGIAHTSGYVSASICTTS